VMGLRVSTEAEVVGLDISLHEETAYDLEAVSTGTATNLFGPSR